MTMLAPATLVCPRDQKLRPNLVGVSRLKFPDVHDRLNHNSFRYPAKFHPPVARALIEQFSEPGQTVLDPFCGSGTALVEGLAIGRSAVGTDIDPLAVLVASAKVRRLDLDQIDALVVRLRDSVTAMREADSSRWGGFELDIDEAEHAAAAMAVAPHIPPLPRMEHWFRRRVVIQLAAIRGLVAAQQDVRVRQFLTLCFASIIRNASNADPVPVSGLEVTSHMRRKEAAGRLIDPYTLFVTAMAKNAAAQRTFAGARREGCTARVATADARFLSERGTGPVNAVVTSPPYLAAVDYYRRHTLEMYWLGLTPSANARREVMPRYIGRDRVGMVYMDSLETHGSRTAADWLPSFPDIRPERARAFQHYCASMDAVFGRMAAIVRPGAAIVFVVGDVRFCGRPVSMVELLGELASPHLALVERIWYPLANRYMSYSRKNEADINADHVLVFERRH